MATSRVGARFVKGDSGMNSNKANSSGNSSWDTPKGSFAPHKTTSSKFSGVGHKTLDRSAMSPTSKVKNNNGTLPKHAKNGQQ